MCASNTNSSVLSSLSAGRHDARQHEEGGKRNERQNAGQVGARDGGANHRRAT